MAKAVKFDIEAMLKALDKRGFVAIKDARLTGYGSDNDLARLMDLFLAHGFRRLTASDLKINTEIVELRYWEKFPFTTTFSFKVSNRKKDADSIHIIRSRIAEITLTAEVKRKREKSSREFTKRTGKKFSLFNSFFEDMFHLKPAKPKRDNTDFDASLGKSMLLHGTGHFPWRYNIDVDRDNLASICLIKIS